MIYSDKSSLLDKYDLQIDQLDYKYVETCKNVKVLENILTVLRSEEEGSFPDLTNFCEKRLRELEPTSELLTPVRQLLSYSDLSENERKEIGKDIESWEKEFEKEERQDTSIKMTSDIPPIRGKSVKIEATDKENKPSGKEKPKTKRCAPRSYSDWDKFNVEDIIEADENEKQKQIKTIVEKNSDLPKIVCVSELSEKERRYVADLEKNKGNEAFKARDYEEAVLYYTRSLSAFKTATTLNNRAQAHIKMKNFFTAVEDCTEVISMEPNNIKALYRRGTAYKESGIYPLAKLDFKSILELDPENKLAKDKLKEIKQLNSNKTMKKKVIIEELNTENTINEAENKIHIHNEDETETSTRLTIQEVENNSSLILPDLNDSTDEDDLPQLSTNVKQMLTVNVNDSKRTKMPNMKVKGIENIFQSKSSNNNKHIMIEECQEIPTKSNAKEQNFNTNKMKNEFVRIKIEESHKNGGMLKIKDNCNKQIKGSNINKNEYTSECHAFPKDGQCNMAQGHNEVLSTSNSKEENTNEQLNKLKSDFKNIKHDKNVHRNTHKNLNFGDNEIQSNQYTTNTSEIDPNLFGDSMEKNGTRSKEDFYENITSYEFLCMWQSRNTSDGRVGSEYLLKIKPKELPKLISNLLDGSLLYEILKAIYHMYEIGIQHLFSKLDGKQSTHRVYMKKILQI